MDKHSSPIATGDEEVCRIAQELIRIDTTNHGDGNAIGEAKAAEYVAGLLTDVGLRPLMFDAAPGRTNLVARWAGKDPALPALLLHGHLDVVPADASEWSVDPFAGVIKDGMLWGRGAVDMKNMVAMILATVREMVRGGEQPKRDIVLAFFADEEDNFTLGSSWMVQNHPEVFAGVDAAITEGGGHSIEVNGREVFLIQTGEKGMLWLRLHGSGKPGHGSLLSPDSAILDVAEAISRIQRESWPLTLTATTHELLERLSNIGGFRSSDHPDEILASTGSSTSELMASLRDTANVTMSNAGYMPCVVPGTASAFIDARPLPGHRDRVLNRIKELAGPNVQVEIVDDVEGFESHFGGLLVDAMKRSVLMHRPHAEFIPYMCSGATDNSSLAKLGIKGFGFTPMLLPPNFDLGELLHGIDERVPLDALIFGQAVLGDLVRSY